MSIFSFGISSGREITGRNDLGDRKPVGSEGEECPGQTGLNVISFFEMFQSKRLISIKTLGGRERKEILQELNLKPIMG